MRRLAPLLPLVTLLLSPSESAADPGPSFELDMATVSTAGGVLRRVHGSQGLGDKGVPVTGGFDANGDGWLDYAFSSMQASPGGINAAGIAYLVFGDGSLSGTLDTAVAQAGILEIHGEVASEATGSELWMDDVTGDGLGDLLIARQNYRPDVTRPGAGALAILVGSAALATHAATLQPIDLANPPVGVVLTTFVGAGAVDRLGIWMRTGDVTGDGIADIVVGADQEDGGGDTDRGAVYLIRGGAHLATGQTVDLANFGATALAGHIAKVVPPAGSNEFHLGATCQIADLDGNGRGEVLAAAALNRSGAGIQADGAPAGSAHANKGSSHGTLYIAWDDNFTGNPWPAGLTFDISLPPGSNTIIDGGVPNRDFGEEILGGLDYDADRLADLFVGDIVGDLSGSRPDAGSGHVLYDAARLKNQVFDMDAPPPGLVISDFLGGASGDIAGDTALHGDFDRDGIDDLAFSSPHASPPGRNEAGILHVFFGQVGGWPATIDLAPGAPPSPDVIRMTNVIGAHGTGPGDTGDVLAYSGATADLNGDGLVDLITNEMLGNGPSSVDHGNLILLSGAVVFLPGCRDGFDNDADGAIDHPADVGCRDLDGSTESPQCQDGINNDPGEDDRIDFDGGLSALGYAAAAPDPQCQGKPWRDCEWPTCCGLGFELALILPGLMWLRRRAH